MNLFYYSTRAQHHLLHGGSSVASMTVPIMGSVAKQENSSFPRMLAIDERLEVLIEDIKMIRGSRASGS